MAAAPEAPADEGNTSGADALTLEEADEKAQGNNAADSKKLPLDFEAEWEKDESNPMNWPTWRKAALVFCISSMGFIASAATSILSPAREQIMEEFHVGSTVALLPVVLYVFALGFGPIIGGPLSETVGRLPVFLIMMPVGALFTLGAGFCHNLGALCFTRFMAGFFWGPLLAVPSATLVETFPPKSRGPPTATFILMPFLGPGLGPVMGSFLVHRKGWRWTQWTTLFFAVFCIIQFPLMRDTFNPKLKRRLAKKLGVEVPPKMPLRAKISLFARVALVRPLHMLVAEPIVSFLCLYVAVNFGILFSFFAGVPYTFTLVYHFSLEQSGLVFLSIATGCMLGFFTIVLCDLLIYRKKTTLFPKSKTPPEYRLYPALMGSFGLPIGLFWFAWSARASVHWAVPTVAIMPFAWGNLCIFVSAMQYTADTYKGLVVASAVSANSLARYTFAGAFPLFTIQMYEKLGIDWSCSLLGFVAVALLPIPWVLFKFGPQIRAKSKYETVDYSI